MTGDKPKATPELLRDRWGQWATIVGLFARRRPARRRVDPMAYAALRDDLIATCRSLAEADGRRRSYYLLLEEMVRPWLSPRVLARTDREILCTLLDRCREVERELGGRRWGLGWPIGLGPVPMLIAGGIIVPCLVWALLEFGSPAIVAARDVIDTAWLTLKYASGYHKLSVVSVSIVVGAIYTIHRSARPVP
jgi:hypothetical protein